MPRVALAAVALLLLLPAAASAEPDADAAPTQGMGAAGQCRSALASPPCGIITPTMDIDLDKKTCALGKTQFTEQDRAECHPLPPIGEPLVLQGTVTWGWKVSDDGVYPNDPATDIEITFPEAAGTPEWMKVTVEPPSFRITTATLADPQYIVPHLDDPANPSVYYEYTQPITVTLERTGDPAPEDLKELAEQRQPPAGIQPVYVKARSNASGAYITAAFAVDIVQFDVASGEAPLIDSSPTKDSPAPVAALLAVGLVMLAAARRQR